MAELDREQLYTEFKQRLEAETKAREEAERAEKERLEALETLDAPTENDMIAVECIGPGTRPDTKCGENVTVRARDAGAIPPLCSRHEGLADRCVKRGRNPWELEA